MIDDKRLLAVIPARGGSKGVPGKNIRLVAGKPLIAWTIEEAKKSAYIDRLILTSDDEEIIAAAKQFGCEVPFVRPKELAADDTPGIEPVLHAIKMIPGYDYVVLLQPTSPLRTVEDIDGCIEQCFKKNAKACVSVTEPDKSPYWMYFVDEEERMKPVVDIGEVVSRRQDLPGTYVLNGAVYVAECNWLLREKSFISKETVAYIMDKTKSIDVDSELDLSICQMLLEP